MASDTSTILLPQPTTAAAAKGYSADVRIQLEVDGRLVFPSHTGPNFLIFLEPQTIIAKSACLNISVDGVDHESRLEILPHESPATRIPVRITERI
jgi:hypothetical protein